MSEEIIDPCKVCGAYKRNSINPEIEYWCDKCGSKYKKVSYGFELVEKSELHKKIIKGKRKIK